MLNDRIARKLLVYCQNEERDNDFSRDGRTNSTNLGSEGTRGLVLVHNDVDDGDDKVRSKTFILYENDG
jgi:hypothetical protein